MTRDGYRGGQPAEEVARLEAERRTQHVEEPTALVYLDRLIAVLAEMVADSNRTRRSA